MINIQLDPALEQRLGKLAEAQGQAIADLIRGIVEEYLDLQAWHKDSEEAWGAASLALAPEVLPDEQWQERDAGHGSR